MTQVVEVPQACLPLAGERRLWQFDGRSIALFNVDGALYAIDDSCPHAGASLANGIVSGRTVQCRAHGLRFDLATGCMVHSPALRIGVHPVTIRDDRVFLTLVAQDEAVQSC